MSNSNLEDQTRILLQNWIDKQGHERCWYYPDIFNELIKLYGIVPNNHPNLPTIEEFKEGCNKYQLEQFTKSPE